MPVLQTQVNWCGASGLLQSTAHGAIRFRMITEPSDLFTADCAGTEHPKTFTTAARGLALQTEQVRQRVDTGRGRKTRQGIGL